MLKIGVKYCGGCNPLYDRVALVKSIEQKLQGKAVFVAAGTEGVDLILAVEGCSTACADLSPFRDARVWMIIAPEDASNFLYHMERAM